jgi:hypothetical protein
MISRLGMGHQFRTHSRYPRLIPHHRHHATPLIHRRRHRCAQDLAQALLSPSPSSPLSPITKSQRHQLIQLSSIFLQHTAQPDVIPITPSPPTPLLHSPFPAPDNIITAPPSVPRVVTPATNTPSSAPAIVPRVAPAATPTPRKRITWAPSVTRGIAPLATYQTATINPGQRRRRATTAQKSAADRAAFLSASITIHPGITSHIWFKRRAITRRSHRRRILQPLPATHINHSQSRVPHITIASHVASFTAQMLQLPTPYNLHTLSLTPTPANHTNMLNLSEAQKPANGYTAPPTNLDASPKASPRTCPQVRKPCDIYFITSFPPAVTQHMLASLSQNVPTKRKLNAFASPSAGTFSIIPTKSAPPLLTYPP